MKFRKLRKSVEETSPDNPQTNPVENRNRISKRKRSAPSKQMPSEFAHHLKKQRQPMEQQEVERDIDMGGDSANAPAQVAELKRDRENTTLIVRNLPEDTTVVQIRQFFRDGGKVIDVHIYEEEVGSKVALVEFENRDDALYSQTRSVKPFRNQFLNIELGTGSTLYVTNYPPEADEKYIRALFSEYGHIVGVRFPSLKGNTHRRFCYVQLLSPDAAYQASLLSGQTVLDGKYHLSVAISNPSKKEARHGPVAEDREIFIRNLDFKTSESEVKTHFDRFGDIEKVIIPKTINGLRKGIAFVAFKTKEDALKAVQQINNTLFQTRRLTVEIAQPKGKRTETYRAAQTADVDMDRGDGEADSSEFFKDRSIAVLNLSDIVNAAQLEKLIQESGETLRKITLRPENAGAIIEMDSKAAAGKLELFLNGKELAGLVIKVGSVPELLKQSGIERAATALEQKKKLGSGVVSRPTRPQAKKKNGQKLRLAQASHVLLQEPNLGANVAPKSNAEFQQMFVRQEPQD